MSVEKPEELQTAPVPQTTPLTDAERAELEALRAEKERRELEALRAEKARAVQAEAPTQAKSTAADEDAQLAAAQQRVARQAAQQEAEQIKGRALMEPDEDDEDIKMPLGQKIVIATVVILAVIFVVSQFIL